MMVGQTITFPQPPHLTCNSGPIELKATSDSGLAVEYHIACGPAVIAGGKLEIADPPALAMFPIAVKVIAYQFGSGVEPLVRTAAPVEQTILIQGP